jgi:uroporphyrinogen-III synthase
MSGPLAGLRVWITRPEPAASKSVTAWRDAGAVASAVATVHLSAVPLDADLLRDMRENLSPGWKVLLTSANATSFLLQALAAEPELRRRLRECPAYAIGEATAARARELGLEVEQVSPRAVGSDFAASLVERGDAGGPLLLPGSDVRRPEVERVLRAAGGDVRACTVYRNAPVTELPAETVECLRRGEVDLLAFYSPSAVRGFLAAAATIVDDPATCCPAAVLGPTTRDEARTAGFSIVAEPASPGEPALIEAAVTWWSEQSCR